MVKHSPLYNLQKKLGGRFTEFAGFEMPIQYSSIKEEHLAVRKTVGIFDVSHMSNVWITGEGAEDLISLTTIEDASKIENKKSQYTALLKEDGTVIDDTIFMHLDEKYMMIPNAGMAEIVTDWLNKIAEDWRLAVKERLRQLEERLLPSLLRLVVWLFELSLYLPESGSEGFSRKYCPHDFFRQKRESESNRVSS